MFDQNYQPKPAFNSVVSALGGTTAGGGSATCQVDYAKTTEWVGGFVAGVTVTNAGTAPINGWTARFSFGGDQRVTSAWNASVSQSGAAVTATNASFNGAIAPGGSAMFGFQGTWANSDAAPASFSVNGAACG
jgi:cellulase/cellobiase CelA1